MTTFNVKCEMWNVIVKRWLERPVHVPLSPHTLPDSQAVRVTGCLYLQWMHFALTTMNFLVIAVLAFIVAAVFVTDYDFRALSYTFLSINLLPMAFLGAVFYWFTTVLRLFRDCSATELGLFWLNWVYFDAQHSDPTSTVTQNGSAKRI